MSPNEWLLSTGLLVLLVAGLPLALRRVPLSLPLVLLALGYVGGQFGWAPLFHEQDFRSQMKPLAEVVMLVALMGAGLKIDRPFRFRTWGTPWRLVGIGMLLSVAGVAAAAHFIAGLNWATAFLAGAVLAPTDPVLAGNVGVGPPGKGAESEARFGLSAEAGFNDGLIYPVVLLALAIVRGHDIGGLWLLDHFVGRVLLSIVLGVAAGRLAGWLSFRAPAVRLSQSGGGMVALGLAFISYAGVELLEGYGFVAVFVSALAFRASRPDDSFHREMVDFTEQIEKLLMLGLLLLFGSALGSGLLRGLGWPEAAVGLLLILVIRPVTAWVSLVGKGFPDRDKATLSFFGVRGISTIFYLVMSRSAVDDPARFSAVVAFGVAFSVVVHGVLATPMLSLAERRGRESQEGASEPEPRDEWSFAREPAREQQR